MLSVWTCLVEFRQTAVISSSERRLGRDVLRGHGDPVERDLGQRIRDPGDVAHVGQRGASDLERPRIQDLDAAAVRREVDVLAVERQVAHRIAGAQRVGRRRLRSARLDQRRRAP